MFTVLYLTPPPRLKVQKMVYNVPSFFCVPADLAFHNKIHIWQKYVKLWWFVQPPTRVQKIKGLLFTSTPPPSVCELSLSFL